MGIALYLVTVGVDDLPGLVEGSSDVAQCIGQIIDPGVRPDLLTDDLAVDRVEVSGRHRAGLYEMWASATSVKHTVRQAASAFSSSPDSANEKRLQCLLVGNESPACNTSATSVSLTSL